MRSKHRLKLAKSIPLSDQEIIFGLTKVSLVSQISRVGSKRLRCVPGVQTLIYQYRAGELLSRLKTSRADFLAVFSLLATTQISRYLQLSRTRSDQLLSPNETRDSETTRKPGEKLMPRSMLQQPPRGAAYKSIVAAARFARNRRRRREHAPHTDRFTP